MSAEQPVNPEEQPEAAERLWSGDGVEVSLPLHPGIPTAEGSEVMIAPEGDPQADWRQMSAAEIANLTFYGLAVATIVAERGHGDDRYGFDAHANFQFDSQNPRGLSMYGRKPLGVEGWARSVRVREGKVDEPGNAAVVQRERGYFERFLSTWQKFKEHLAPFRDGVKPMAPDSEEFRQEQKTYAEREYPYQETLLWANQKVALVGVQYPHVDGIHLVAHSRPEYWEQHGGFQKPWQQTVEHGNGFIETVLIAKVAQEILSERADQLQFYNPELRCSGNFSKDFLPEDQGGLLDEPDLRQAKAKGRLALKQAHRRYQQRRADRAAGGVGGLPHVHVYGTRDPQRFVQLAWRPRNERPDLYEHIPPFDPAEGQRLFDLMQSELTPRLERELGRMQG